MMSEALSSKREYLLQKDGTKEKLKCFKCDTAEGVTRRKHMSDRPYCDRCYEAVIKENIKRNI